MPFRACWQTDNEKHPQWHWSDWTGHLRSEGTQELRKHKVRSGTCSCCQTEIFTFCSSISVSEWEYALLSFSVGEIKSFVTRPTGWTATPSVQFDTLYKDEIISKHDHHYNIFKALDWWNDWRRVSQSHNSRAEENWQYVIAVSKTNSRTTADGQCLISLIWYFYQRTTLFSLSKTDEGMCIINLHRNLNLVYPCLRQQLDNSIFLKEQFTQKWENILFQTCMTIFLLQNIKA